MKHKIAQPKQEITYFHKYIISVITTKTKTMTNIYELYLYA